MSLKQKIYNVLPCFMKNILVTIYNLRFISIYGKLYQEQLEKQKIIFFEKSFEEILAIQKLKLYKFLSFARESNVYYKSIIPGDNNILDNFKLLPILTKDDFKTKVAPSNVGKQVLIKGNTGGTTGKSMSFYMTKDDYIERQASVNFFRGMYGYKFKDKIAWFSGKEIITKKDESRNVFWVQDYINNITYFSTFHLYDEALIKMIGRINNKKIEFMAGFPSAIYDLAKVWQKYGIPIRAKIKAIFMTSEPLHDYQKEFLEKFFDCKVPNQYASSEGAPFIYECPNGVLHYDMQTGIFENVNKDGEILVTSFTTHAMPLIRYEIGDTILFKGNVGERCKCGSFMPQVEQIVGRAVSFIYSKERGKITVSNISNVIKKIQGVDKFQILQDFEDEILVKVVLNNLHNNDSKKILPLLEYELRYRLGDILKINYEFVDNIASEKNGKFLMVKNSLKL